MKARGSFLGKAYNVLMLVLGGGILGAITGFSLFSRFAPPWKFYALPAMPEKPVAFLHVDWNSTLDDPTNDVLYVKSDAGHVYFLRVGEKTWQLMEPLPNGEIELLRIKEAAYNAPLVAMNSNGQFFELHDGQWQAIPALKEPWGWWSETDSCATAWADRPSFFQGVVASSGWLIERPISTIKQCFVVLKDGSVQSWTRSINVFNHFDVMYSACSIGGAVGVIVGICLWFLPRRSSRS